MHYQYSPSFVRDVKKSTTDVQGSVWGVIENIKAARTLHDISNMKKLKGYKTAYRIKVKTHRLCFYYENVMITIARFLPRKDVYQFFP